jgi:aspartate/methionine/tyrosine aminotransferase
MPAISPRADAVSHSGIREIVNLAIDRGPAICRLEIGEPDFRTPGHIVDAGMAVARSGARYTHSAGTAAVREAAAAKLARVNGLDVPTEGVVMCQGAVQGCALVFAALLEPGDEVLIPDPAWPNYEMLVRLHGATAVPYPLRSRDGFLPDVEELQGLVTDRTVALVVNSPSNPTGVVFPRPVVEALVEVAARADLLLISDEVYDELIFEGAPSNAVAVDPEHVVGVYSCSKTYAMTGWRVGYLAAPAWLRGTLAKLQEPLVSCISAVSQAAAVAAFTGPQACVDEMRAAYAARRDLVVRLLRDAGIVSVSPHGAFYLMLPFAPGVDGRAAVLDLVEHGVALAPGTAFGGVAADQARLSLASSEDILEEGVRRIVSWYRRTEGGALPATRGPR